MTEREQTEIFAENLRMYMSKYNYKQVEVAEAIGVNPQTFNTWIKAKAIPRMDKVQKLADFFGIRKSELVDRHDEITEETIYDILERRGDLRDLMYLVKDMPKDQIQLIVRIARAMR